MVAALISASVSPPIRVIFRAKERVRLRVMVMVRVRGTFNPDLPHKLVTCRLLFKSFDKKQAQPSSIRDTTSTSFSSKLGPCLACHVRHSGTV